MRTESSCFGVAEGANQKDCSPRYMWDFWAREKGCTPKTCHLTRHVDGTTPKVYQRQTHEEKGDRYNDM